MAWTDDRVELLKQLWADGLSASQIANKMGGVTRNAVIGKVHRLGLSGRATPAKPRTGRVPERPKALPQKSFQRAIPNNNKGLKSVLIEPEFLEPLVLDTGDNATISTLSNSMCKWPIGDPASDAFHFCGQGTSKNKSYCAYHAHLAFQPSQKRERPPKVLVRSIAAPKRAAG